MRPLRLSVLGIIASGTQFAFAVDPGHWINKEVFDRIQLSGHRTVGYHMQDIEGDREAFKSLTYSGRGGSRFTDTGMINIGGRKVLGVLNFDMQLTDDRYADPETKRISVDYARGPVTVNAGDIRGSLLNTNQFASFSRSMKGVSVGLQHGRAAFKTVYSQAKGNASTITIQGENSVGPYYLRTSRISRDSIQVKVDGQDLRLLEDYVVNYDAGTITFNNRIISPTSTILVSYESLGTGRNTGTVRGYGASYDMGSYGKVGLTQITQTPLGASGLNSRTDLFQGFGDPSTPYVLTFEPLRSRPIIVKLQGIVQTEGIHYRFDETNPAVFYFLFFVPPTSNVDVSYTPRPSQTIDGARKVTGFDYRLPLGKNGGITYTQATGELDNDINPMKGTARGLDFNYKLGELQFRANLRDVPNDFVGVESRSFLRNEKATVLDLRGGNDKLRYGVSHNNSLVGSRRTDNSGQFYFDNNRVTQTRAYTTFTPGDGRESYSLEQVRNTSDSTLGTTQVDTTGLNASRQFGRFTTSLGASRTSGRGPYSFGNSEVRERNVALDTLRLSTSYFAGPEWVLGGQFSLSNIDADGKKSRGSDYSLGLAYRPEKKLTASLNHYRSDSGDLASLSGFNNGFGVGYDGNAFTTGQTSTSFFTGSGAKFNSTTLALTYEVSSNADLAARFSDSASQGSLSSNARTRQLGLDFDWRIDKSHRTGFSVIRTDSDFVGSAIASNATSLDWYFEASPQGPWNYKLGFVTLLSEGNTEFNQDSFGFDGFLGYKIDDRQRLGFGMHTGRTRGYLPQNETYYGLSYEHQLFQNISLIGSYRWRNVSNLDPTQRTGAYRSQGLDIEISFNFVP